MTRSLPRAHFSSSRLVRFLTENAMVDAARVEGDLGQKLGDWLNFRQAIALHGMLNPVDPPVQPVHRRRVALMTGDALSRHVEKVRAQLEQSILQGAPPGSGLARVDMPPAALDEPIEPKTAFEPYRRFYSAHQRQMDATIRALRAQVRVQVAQSSAALQQLAALDAAFDPILCEREASLLAKVIKMHEKRFVQVLKTHMKQQADASSANAWLMPLRQSLRSALLAELDTRMQPTLGLLDAFKQENPS